MRRGRFYDGKDRYSRQGAAAPPGGTDVLLLSGDMNSGSKLLLSGDMQSGTDKLSLSGT